MPEIKTVPQLVQAYDRMKGAVLRAREHTESIVERGTALAAGAGGGVASGFVRGMGYAKLPKTDVDADLALGLAAALPAVMGIGGKSSGALLAFGIGLAAPALSRMTEGPVSRWNSGR